MADRSTAPAGRAPPAARSDDRRGSQSASHVAERPAPGTIAPADPLEAHGSEPVPALAERAGGAPLGQRRANRFAFTGSLRERAARGTLINTGFLVGLAAINLLRAFVLARFISRTDYGIWGVLVVALGTILWLKQVGIGDKYVQQDESDQEAAFQKAFTLELLITLAFAAAVAAALPLIALAYGVPSLVAPGMVVLVAFVAAAFQAPLWIYYRRMEFARQRMLQAVDPLVGFATSVALAVAGAGYWSFAGGFTAGAIAAAAVAVAASPYAIRLRFDRRTFREYLGFSWPLFVAGGAALVIAQAAVLTGRWHLGLSATGVIALAAALSSFSERVDDVVTGTLYPAICAIRDRATLVYESFVKSNRLALMWAVPFGVGLTLFARDLVAYGIGHRWDPAIVVLEVYGLTAAVNHLGFNWTAYLQATATTRPIAVANVGSAALFLATGIPLILGFGLPGFAISIVVLTLTQLAFRGYYLQRFFGGFSFLRHSVRAFLPTLPAAGAVLLARLVEPAGRSPGIAIAELALYALVTIAATLYLETDLIREALGYLIGRRPEPRQG